ncbi:MAG: S9 family peptidase [Bacteroidota bacterium]
MKKNTFFLCCCLSLLMACQQDKTVNEKPADLKQYTVEQFMDNTSIFGGSFSHDESKILVGNNQSGIFNAYTVPVGGGAMVPLTESEETIRPRSFFPNDNRIIYSSDKGGNERYHLFVRNEDGTILELTPGDESRASFYGWANDQKSFFISWNVRDQRYMDVYEVSLSDLKPKMIYQNDKSYNFGGISNDKNYMALSKSINTNDSDLFIHNFESGETKKISTEQAAHQAADFSVDSKTLYYLTNHGSEFNFLKKYDIASGEHQKVEEANWDISYAYFSKKGKYRVIGTNEDGKTVVQIRDVETDKIVDFPKFPGGNITSVNFSNSEKLMSFYVGSSNNTSNLYIYNFADGSHKKLSNTLNAEIDQSDLVAAEVVRFKSFDQLDIPAIYYKPKQASAANPVPAMVYVHGGPGGQSRMGYNAMVQYLVNHGYAILMVNNRGSSGYGKTFFQMDDRNHGEADLKDCIAGRDYLASLDYIDKDKIGIIGGSYGGFMVMRAMTHTPEAFKVGVNIFGVTNWLRTLKSIPPWWESFKDALYLEMGDPAQDSVRLYNISPLFHADKIVNPVMVLQGAEDPRVLQVESDEMVEAMRKNDIPVEYVLFEDEGHGFVKKENQIEAYGKILQFVEKFLNKEPEVKG